MANGKSLTSSLADFFAADLPSAGSGDAASRVSTGEIGWDKSFTAGNPFPLHSSNYSPAPWTRGLLAWGRRRLRGRGPSRLPEYPRLGVDCPRIFFGAPASG